MNTPWFVARHLKKLGILGINSRNAEYVLQHNKRSDYPKADSKIRTKAIAIAAGIPVPELFCSIDSIAQFSSLKETLSSENSFVIKPAHGSGGEGVLVLNRNSTGELVDSSGEIIPEETLKLHVANVIHGLYSLGGQPDQAMAEYKVNFDPAFEKITYRGVPDVRIVVFRGVPAMAMMRLPTKRSSGRANLHQGAVGVGIDISSGITRGGVIDSTPISTHPDTENEIENISIPHWDAMLTIACKAYDLFKLGYLGIDIVIDRNRGPMVLEVNVRPGLAIQLANKRGLKPRLALIDKNAKELQSIEKRLKFARESVGALL